MYITEPDRANGLLSLLALSSLAVLTRKEDAVESGLWLALIMLCAFFLFYLF